MNNRLLHGPPILIDGGTGTEIERRGGGMHSGAWSARASLTHPRLVRDVHRSFLDAGAELIIANTYPSNYHVMAAAGLSHEFGQANRAALDQALEARAHVQSDFPQREIWVAGSMSTTTFTGGIDASVIKSAGPPGEGYRAQAEIIAQSDVDLIILEMMRDVEETLSCLEAAQETGLPVWLGLSAEQQKDGTMVFHGSAEPFAEGLHAILDRATPPHALGVMHSEVAVTPEALGMVSQVWDGPLFAYPHQGVFDMPNWRFDDSISPEEFAHAALQWVQQGATAVGGCCGIRPEHIAQLRKQLKALR